jgi:hypothetical protein
MGVGRFVEGIGFRSSTFLFGSLLSDRDSWHLARRDLRKVNALGSFSFSLPNEVGEEHGEVACLSEKVVE